MKRNWKKLLKISLKIVILAQVVLTPGIKEYLVWVTSKLFEKFKFIFKLY
jgi:hypothetical protein